jgi:hypothetical protein
MYTASMFESIKEAIKNSAKSGGNPLYKEILKFKPGNTYILRLLPNVKDLANTFYHFYVHGWNSFATGEYVSSVSLQTIGKPDPIGTEVYRMKKMGSPEEKEKIEAVKWQEQWYVNVYVVDDPVTPENNGTVKILRFGRKLNKLIEEAISGSDSDEFGPRVFDLSENGVNLKLKVEKNEGGFVNYDSSRFTSPQNLNLSAEKQEEIYNSIHDLTAINPLKTEEEIVQLWNKHFLCTEGLPSLKKDKEEQDSSTVQESPATQQTSDSKIEDDMVKELLKGLEDN